MLRIHESSLLATTPPLHCAADTCQRAQTQFIIVVDALNSPISVKIIRVAYIIFVLKVELTGVFP